MRIPKWFKILIYGKDRSIRYDHYLEILTETIRVFGTKENAEHWLKSPVMALGGARPIDYLDTPERRELIKTLLGRIEYGVYS